MIEFETMTFAELKAFSKTVEEIRRERLNDELTKREEKIQSLLDECFDLIEESGLEVYANTPHGSYEDKFDFAEVLAFEFADDEE